MSDENEVVSALPALIAEESSYIGHDGRTITEHFFLRRLATFEGYSKSIRSDPRTAELTLSIGVPTTSRQQAYVVDERPGTIFTIVVYERVTGQELERDFRPDELPPPVRLRVIDGKEAVEVDGWDLEDRESVERTLRDHPSMRGPGE